MCRLLAHRGGEGLAWALRRLNIIVPAPELAGLEMSTTQYGWIFIVEHNTGVGSPCAQKKGPSWPVHRAIDMFAHSFFFFFFFFLLPLFLLSFSVSRALIVVIVMMMMIMMMIVIVAGERQSRDVIQKMSSPTILSFRITYGSWTAIFSRAGRHGS